VNISRQTSPLDCSTA